MAGCIIPFVNILTLNLEGSSYAFICFLFIKHLEQALCWESDAGGTTEE